MDNPNNEKSEVNTYILALPPTPGMNVRLKYCTTCSEVHWWLIDVNSADVA